MSIAAASEQRHVRLGVTTRSPASVAGGSNRLPPRSSRTACMPIHATSLEYETKCDQERSGDDGYLSGERLIGQPLRALNQAACFANCKLRWDTDRPLNTMLRHSAISPRNEPTNPTRGTTIQTCANPLPLYKPRSRPDSSSRRLPRSGQKSFPDSGHR